MPYKQKEYIMHKTQYPDYIYENITDDPDTWEGSCSKELAIMRAEEYYDTYERITNAKDAACAIGLGFAIALGCMLVSSIILLIPVLALYHLSANLTLAFLPVISVSIFMSIRKFRQFAHHFTNSFDDYALLGQPVGYLMTMLIYAIAIFV